MAELALALSIVSLIKLSNTVLTNCADYVDKVKNAPSDINKIINEVSGLEFILKRLSKLAAPELGDYRSIGENDLGLTSSTNKSTADNPSPADSDSRLTSLRALHQLRHGGPFNGCNEVLAEMAKSLRKSLHLGHYGDVLFCGHLRAGSWRSCSLALKSIKLRSCWP